MAASREVSTMIKQGFISDPTLSFSPSRTSSTTVNSRVLISPNSKTLFSSPPHFTSNQPNRPAHHPTLFQMMSEEQTPEQNRQISQSKISKILKEIEDLNNNYGLGAGDVKITMGGKDGFNKIQCIVPKRVLTEKSAFFREKLRDKEKGIIMHSVEISECDDVEVSLETLALMYSNDLKKRLMYEEVSKVLGFLKVSADIMFDTGIMSCLEYLEAVPWSEDEEEKIISHLTELELRGSAAEVLQRVSSQASTSTTADDIFLRLLNGVLQAKDDKARHEMKNVISRLLKEDSSCRGDKLDVSRDTLYSLCHGCLSSLVLCLSEATTMDDPRGGVMTYIAREAENLQWIIEILVDKKSAEEFVKVWGEQRELAVLHSKIPIIYRHEISKITAQLCIAIGRGKILAPKETRFSLLSTWLEALYEDFGWMRRAGRAFDKKEVEEGIGRTILTLPLQQQQCILLKWFDRFLKKGDDCPNIQRSFEVWWRRAFVRQYVAEENPELQVTVCSYPN